MTERLWEVMTSMSMDMAAQAVRPDSLILSLGEQLALKHGHDKAKHSFIRNQLRELGRLLVELRKNQKGGTWTLSMFVSPQLFEDILVATRCVCGFQTTSTSYKTPSLALKLGHSLKKYAYILKGQAIASGDERMITQASRYLELHEMEWTNKVSSNALRTLYVEKKNTTTLIPLSREGKLLT